MVAVMIDLIDQTRQIIKMIKYLLAIGFIFTSSLSFSQDDIAKSIWISSPVKIDGNAQEWILPLRYYDPGTKLFFAFANDDKNLYLCFQTPDEMNEMKIMHAGMKVTLSTKGKHKASVNFPLVQKTESVPPENENTGQQSFDRKNRRNSFLIKNTMMEVKGFATRSGMIPINDSSGINASINWDEANKFTYEIAIPFKELFGNDYNAADISKDISLDIDINAVTKQNYPNFGMEENGRRGRGGRNGGGDGMNHERNENREEGNSQQTMENRMAMLMKSKLRQKFILAQNSNNK